MRVEWRSVLDQLRQEIATRPAIVSSFSFAAQRRVPASDPRTMPALVQLNALTSPLFPGIAQSPIPVLLPFDPASYLEARQGSAPDGLPVARYQADFRAADVFHAGASGYDAVFSLDPGAGDGMPLRTFAKPVEVQISGSILVYLAEKFGAFLPTDVKTRAETFSWLFWQMGSAPYLGGGFGHFYAYAPTKIEYAIDRFAMEVKRQLDVLDRRLADNEYLAGDVYTIADMAVWPWYGGLAKGLLYGGGEFLSVQDYKNVQRWTDAIAARPAVKRGRMVNRTWGEPSSQLHERHDASDFETRTQDKISEQAAS